LRRQNGVGGLALAGSSRLARLDPFSLPLSFFTSDADADGGSRLVELHQQHVIVRRALRGMAMTVNLPVRAFLGIALHLRPPRRSGDGGVSVVMEHHDPGLSVPLYAASDGVDIVAEWHSWAQVLGLPLLVVDPDGALREAFPQFGPLRVATPVARRRRRGPTRSRRPSFLLRRKPGVCAAMPVHAGEREIIARN
jgi:hypothetical protein